MDWARQSCSARRMRASKCGKLMVHEENIAITDGAPELLTRRAAGDADYLMNRVIS